MILESTTTEAERGNSKSAPSRMSRMAEGLIGSEILKIAADVRAMVSRGEEICNLTVGDFDPEQFPIPSLLRDGIVDALDRGETNYPPSDGVLPLRRAIASFNNRRLRLVHPIESILVTGGSRPGIYATYRAVVDPGDTVIYPVPSWNNNHYCHLVGARGVAVECSAANRFLPTAAEIEPHIATARLLVLNSPLNPTGTAFTREGLGEICDLVIRENLRRSGKERPLYVMYDQVYWQLMLGGFEHVDPVTLRSEMSAYTIYVDGISKAFAATGVRVGWTLAPPDISAGMAGILGHIGAWAPRAEQIAVAEFLQSDAAIDSFSAAMRAGIDERLCLLHAGIEELREKGYAVETIDPMGAIYITARFNLTGRRTELGEVLGSNESIRRYLLESAGLAIVPFQAFGVVADNGWFRLSVGAVSVDAISAMLPRLTMALDRLV